MTDAGIVAGRFAPNPDVLCPTTGLVCPARFELVRLFTEFVSPEVDAQMPPELRSHLNGGKLNVRLGEYALTAKRIGCEGPQENICPARTAMDQSPVRSSLVSILRKVIGREI